MTGEGASLEVLLREVREVRAAQARIERELAALNAGGKRRANPESVLLTKRAAARVLGVDRATTLEAYLRAGLLRTVQVGGKTRIPLKEIERVQRDGLPDVEALPRRRAEKRKAPPTGRALREGFKSLVVD